MSLSSVVVLAVFLIFVLVASLPLASRLGQFRHRRSKQGGICCQCTLNQNSRPSGIFVSSRLNFDVHCAG